MSTGPRPIVDEVGAAVLIKGGGLDVSIPEPPDGSCLIRPYIVVGNYSSDAQTVRMVQLSPVGSDLRLKSEGNSVIVPPNDDRTFWAPRLTVPASPTIQQDLEYGFEYGPVGRSLAVRVYGRCRVIAQEQIGNTTIRDNSLEFVKTEKRELL